MSGLLAGLENVVAGRQFCLSWAVKLAHTATGNTISPHHFFLVSVCQQPYNQLLASTLIHILFTDFIWISIFDMVIN